MASLWQVDASHGGGQLLRTALTIAALRGQPCRLSGIRAARSNPGLQQQHLMGVRAVAAAVGGRLEGDQLRSTTLSFHPGDASGAVHQRIDIGTAGSTTLILQAMLPILVRRGGTLAISGGTDNPLAPPVDFTRNVLLPALAALGITIDITLDQRGYYPKGGGQIRASAPAHDGWQGVNRVIWLGPCRVRGVAYTSKLESHVAARMARTAAEAVRLAKGAPRGLRDTLRGIDLVLHEQWQEPALSPGAGIVLWAEDEAGTRVAASGLGSRGLPAEQVGRQAGEALVAELSGDAPCDKHLGDQLAIWAALAESSSVWTVASHDEHLPISLALLREGLGIDYRFDGRRVTVTPNP